MKKEKQRRRSSIMCVFLEKNPNTSNVLCSFFLVLLLSLLCVLLLLLLRVDDAECEIETRTEKAVGVVSGSQTVLVVFL